MIDSEVSNYEFLVRNIYYTSQYSNSTGIKKNFLYPNYKKESRDFPGRHRCRVSVQRVCAGKWDRIVKSALNTKSKTQELKGFCIAPAHTVKEYGFYMEPASHEKNLYHAHIVIPELDLQYPNPDENLIKVMNSGLKRRLDDLSEEFEFIAIDNLKDQEAKCYYPNCRECLNG